MTKSEKVEMLKRLVAKGEELCARVCAMDWRISDKTVNRIVEEYGI